MERSHNFHFSENTCCVEQSTKGFQFEKELIFFQEIQFRMGVVERLRRASVSHIFRSPDKMPSMLLVIEARKAL